MHNPFISPADDSPETEAQAAELFGGLSSENLPVEAATSIRESMLSALLSTGRAVGAGRGFAFAGSAFVAPLLVVGAVSAAAGESPVAGTVAAFETAASAFGVGGKSADTRQDLDVRNEAAGDVGQPGSQPGATGDAPGLTGDLPGGGSSTQEAAADAEDGDEDTAGGGSEASAAAHTNEKGCDDVLFAAGEPPFATPGGPVGCEVGNSADHRQNGVKQADEGAAVTEGDEESPGGVSRGLGLGHEEDGPGQGVGAGHDKHEHEPNENGYGPGGPGADSGDTAAPAESSTLPAPAADRRPETAGKKN